MGRGQANTCQVETARLWGRLPSADRGQYSLGGVRETVG